MLCKYLFVFWVDEMRVLVGSEFTVCTNVVSLTSDLRDVHVVWIVLAFRDEPLFKITSVHYSFFVMCVFFEQCVVVKNAVIHIGAAIILCDKMEGYDNWIVYCMHSQKHTDVHSYEQFLQVN